MRRFIRILGVFLIRGNLNNNRWRVETSLILITVLTTGTVSGLTTTTLKTFKIIKDQKAWIKSFSLRSSPLCYQQFRNSDFPFSSPSPLRNLAKVTLLLCCDILFVNVLVSVFVCIHFCVKSVCMKVSIYKFVHLLV